MADRSESPNSGIRYHDATREQVAARHEEWNLDEKDVFMQDTPFQHGMIMGLAAAQQEREVDASRVKAKEKKSQRSEARAAAADERIARSVHFLESQGHRINEPDPWWVVTGQWIVRGVYAVALAGLGYLGFMAYTFLK